MRVLIEFLGVAGAFISLTPDYHGFALVKNFMHLLSESLSTGIFEFLKDFSEKKNTIRK